MLIGPASFIKKARRIRKALGGGMRQSGILAAAGLQALDDFESGLLEEDHRKAKFLSEQLADLPGLLVNSNTVDTNIILVHLEYPASDPASFAAKLKTQGVLVLPFGPRSLRIVTHRDIAQDDLSLVINAFRDVSAQEWLAFTINTDKELDRINPSADDPRDTTIFHSVHEEEQSRGVELQHQDNVNSMITIEHNPIEQKTNQVNSIVDTDVGSSSSSITDASRQISISDEQTLSSDTMSIVSSSSSSSSLPTTVAVQALATTNVPSKIDITITSDNSKPNFEEVCIFGMTVSPEGFCVLLQGLICDRILKVLVTPQDPMSDGLDRNEVETSEAVTLLQLLQGIDVETYLAHDALSTHFGGDNKHKYSLRQVTIKEVDPKKKFSGSLMGKKRQLSDVSDGATTPISTSGISILSSSSSHRPTVLIQENNSNNNNRDDANNNNYNYNNNIQQDLSSPSSGVPDSSSAPIVLSASSSGLSSSSSSSTAITYGLSGSNNGNGSSSSSSSSQSLTEVKVDSAYFAIALALRHNTAIVVRSDLLHDEELSYTTDEIRSYYPKMVETTTSFIPKIDSRGTEYVRGLMVKRYYEAIRQRNEEKIRQFESYVNYNVSVDGSSRSSSNVGVNYIVGQDSNVTNASI